MSQHLIIDQIIDSADARVIVRRDAAGRVLDAHFDLSGLPRVDALMVGRPLIEVPDLVEHLCGICPAAHHLAGTAALEAIWGPIALTPTTQAVRRLLNFASVIDSHVLGFVGVDMDAVLALRKLAKAAMRAAGSPGHFPTTAVVGGVSKTVDHADIAAVELLVLPAEAAAARLVRITEETTPIENTFQGADVALVAADGTIDLVGPYLRARAADGTVVVAGETADHWPAIIAESRPGDPAPRPYLVALGPTAGAYRTGPVAQLRVGSLATPLAAAAQSAWRGGAAEARAIIVLHCVEAIALLCQLPELMFDEPTLNTGVRPRGGVGVGWVETGRGLLVHRYVVNDRGVVTAATILTPTVQNEAWLADLLQQAPDEAAMEDAIREADPCLPCSTAPAGMMGLQVDTEYV